MPTINETMKQLEAHRRLAEKELAGLEAAINALKPLVASTSAPTKTAAPVAAPAKPVTAKAAKKRTLSAAGRANIQAATKARWARFKAEQAKAKK